jgi:hypothetical protein
MFCRSFPVVLSFVFWSLCCLSFDLRILITPLVFSNSVYFSKTKKKKPFHMKFNSFSLVITERNIQYFILCMPFYIFYFYLAFK